LIRDGEFAGQRALVVGGSRGLGEVAAKLLAAGGAQVQVTYRMGKSDAKKIADEIIAGGGQAGIQELDVLQPQNDWSGLVAPTHLYYFASPLISGSDKTGFSSALFGSFCNYYVNGFARLVESLQKLGLRNVFYPSTVFIDELPENFFEYAMAKNAGEKLCQAFSKKFPEMNFFCPRLPKMATDQTVSFHAVQSQDPAPIILSALRKFPVA
jgi:nucleoside-diphosphate-sugar epimerase